MKKILPIALVLGCVLGMPSSSLAAPPVQDDPIRQEAKLFEGVLASEAEDLEALLDQSEKLGPSFAEGQMKTLRGSAEKGVASAQYRLAWFLQKGILTRQDPKEAVSWYEKAGKAGVPAAFYKLGLMFLGDPDGGGMRPDPLQAVRTFRKGAEAGDTASMFSLGAMLIEGEGEGKAFPEAHAWMTLAGKRSVPATDQLADLKERTKTSLETLVKTMTPADLKEAEAKRKELESRLPK